MSQGFNPTYHITPSIATLLMEIEATRKEVELLPINPTVLSSLRETAKLYTTHYSTMIEGNRLNTDEIQQVITKKGSIPEKKRDEHEVKGYYAALEQVEEYVQKKQPISEHVIKTLHALVMSNGTKQVKPTRYRDGQNVIKGSQTGAIVYMPPEADDVPKLMQALVAWILKNKQLPCPLVAALAHYQFATIHPYYDGNGRTARLLTTLILHLGGYDLKGLYSLEEYYAQDLPRYYQELTVDPSHNYYFGRAEADLTDWISYFLQGMNIAFKKVSHQMMQSKKRGGRDYAHLLKQLDPRQRKALELFKLHNTITSVQISTLFGFAQRTSAALCKKWVASGFLEIADPSFKGRKYKIGKLFEPLTDR